MTQDRTLAAAGAIAIFAVIVGYLDNYVRVIAADGGLWQFHATRTAIALPLLAGVARVSGARLRPVNLRGVAGRSLIHGLSMLIYFGALAFLPVAQVAAGLFTAPIFVLLIGRIGYGRRIAPMQALAVAVGFFGVVLVLGPEAVQGARVASLLPVAAGAMYAMGNIATREWCGGETAVTLLFGFFAALGVLGLLGMLVLAAYPVPVADGAAGFVARGWVTPSRTFLFWTALQAAGSMLAVGMMIRAYQIASAARVSVFEYLILPASAFWGWILWGEVLTPVAGIGMALIAVAGLMIARGGVQPVAPSTA
jgi:drug/metabolite transporter (DMT)-like permease